MGLRVVVIGATGNVGTSVLEALGQEPLIDEIVGVARRRPELEMPKTSWAEIDIADRAGLVEVMRGANAAIHLAWAIQPSRDEATLQRINVEGSAHVFEAAAAAEVPALVYASSVGAYGPGPKDRAVDESWPTTGIPTSFYSRHKAAVEALLDRFEQRHPEVRVVRMRPALIFKGEAANEIRRLFVGPFLPNALVHPRLIPIVPQIAGLRFQAVHSRDVGEAYRQAVVRDVRGAFNLAADPVLDPERLAEALGARPLAVSPRVARALVDWSWKLRLQPSPPGWLDMALKVPLLDSGRAREELGWQPRVDAVEALLELMAGMRHSEGLETPPLDRETGGPARLGELRSGVGARQ